MRKKIMKVMVLLAGTSSSALAGSWEARVISESADKAMSYHILRQPIPGFLRVLSRDAGVQIDLTDNVAGTITDLSVSGALTDVLDAVASQGNLQWFTFNGTFYVSMAEEAEVRLLKTGSMPINTIMAAIEDMGLSDQRFPMTIAAGGKTIAITGPPKLLALKEAILEGIASENKEIPPPVLLVPQLPTYPPAQSGVTIFRNLSRTVVR